MDRKSIKKAVDSAQRAQRNYDLSRQLPADDLDTLIYAAKNSPSKQNETHYSLHIFTDHKTIKNIYKQTKLFSLIKDPTDFDQCFSESEGKFWQNKDMSVYNSQILASVLFVFEEMHGEARCGNSIIAQTSQDQNTESVRIYQEQIDYSIGIAVGELILTASLLGYKTGICSAFSRGDVKDIVGSKTEPKLLVGVGYKNIDIDRQSHAETLNSDVPPKFRTGRENERWRFPSFEKNCKVFLNGKDYT